MARRVTAVEPATNIAKLIDIHGQSCSIPPCISKANYAIGPYIVPTHRSNHRRGEWFAYNRQR